MTLKHIDLFSGIGGFALALRQISKPVLFCDINPYSQTVLQSNMKKGLLPRAPIVPDVRHVTRASVSGKPDMICSSFPCVGFSLAGLRQHFEEPQTKLFYEMVRIIDLFKTPLVFMENVPNVLVHGMNVVSKELVYKRGYELRWVVLPAYSVGLPHSRNRWFCLAVKPGYHHRWPRVGGVFHPGKAPSRMHPARGVQDLFALSALGDALIPAVARMAFLLLISCFHSTKGGTLTLRHDCETEHARQVALGRPWPKCGIARGGVRLALPCPDFKKPDCKLVLVGPKREPARSPMRQLPSLKTKKLLLWATPRAGAISRSHALTRRSGKDLSTQMTLERGTPAAQRKGYPNPRWVEWLMGFPQGWLLL